ncbi:MAG: threonylcarbamoyl-AMP synthase [Ignavibacteriae bacterium]|nr:threonylcarbamoyl-AMP synthase [Ignavibacteriota bacterium]
MGKLLPLHLKRVSSEVVQQAASIIRHGGVILYPTDTIYGLGCNAFDEQAIARIVTIKKRTETKPMLVLVRNISMLRDLVVDIQLLATTLMKRFWPGPLTMIFHARNNVSSLLTARSGKIGIRIPRNNFCMKLIKECQTPIVSTSANISSGRPVSDIASLKQDYLAKVDVMIDAGNLSTTLPSTVVDVSDGKLKIIREGAIRTSELSEYC